MSLPTDISYHVESQPKGEMPRNVSAMPTRESSLAKVYQSIAEDCRNQTQAYLDRTSPGEAGE